MKASRPISAFAALSFLVQTTVAAPPTLDAITPPGGKAGSEVAITLVGKYEPWPCQLHFSEPGFQFVPDPEKKGTGKLKIPGGFKKNAVLIRSHNAEGVSEPVIFAVGNTREIQDDEKDENKVSKAAPLDPATFPLVINGRLQKRDELDGWKLSLNKGQTVFAYVDAYSLRSPVDPVLHVYDAKGNRIEIQHDGPVNLDSRLRFTAPEKGDYIVAIVGFAHPAAATIHYVGSEKIVYRIHFANEEKQLPEHFVPKDIGKDHSEAKAPLPFKIGGTLTKPLQKNPVTVTAKKGDSWWLQADAYSLGFPTDPVLAIYNAEGKSIREVDDVKPDRDAEYLWKVSADGEYKIEVRDRLGRHGENFRYQLSAEKPVPDFSAVAEKSNYLVKAGEEVSIKVTITRVQDHKVPLSVRVDPLPKGLILTPPDSIPDKSGDITLKLKASNPATPFSGPIRIILSEKPEGEAKGKEKPASFTFQGTDARGPYLIDETEEVWLTIPPPPPPPKKEEKKKDDGKKEEKK